MKNEFLPWNFVHDDSHWLTVLYGTDLALSLSLSRDIESQFYDEDAIKSDQSVLYSTSLFGDNLPIRILASTKFAEDLLKKYDRDPFGSKCILVVDGNIKTKLSNVIYVKCDELNKRSRKWFVEFYNKKFGANISSESNVNNLDDFKFAIVKEKLNWDGIEKIEEKSFDIWGTIRLEQFRNKKLKQCIFKDLELWARNNVPHDECLQMCYNKVKAELEKL